MLRVVLCSLMMLTGVIVSAAPVQNVSKVILGFKVRSLVEGSNVGAWPDSPVQLRDGRTFYNDGNIKQIVNNEVHIVKYDTSRCPSMNGSMVLAATSDNHLVIGFDPEALGSENNVVGLVDPALGSCQVLARAPAGTSEIVALATDRSNTIYYAIASGGINEFQFLKLVIGKEPELLFSVTGNIPTDLAVDSGGNLLTSWYSKAGGIYSNQITQWSLADQKLTVYAGNGNPGFSPNGTAVDKAAIGSPYGITFDLADNLYIAQEGSINRITRIDAKTRTISIFAGCGYSWYIASRSWARWTGMNPRGITLTPSGTLIYTDIHSYFGVFSAVREIKVERL